MSSEPLQSDLTTPIGSLPGELVCKILLQAASSLPDEYETAKAWQTRVDLTRVCKAWRNSVLDYSSYWAGVPLHPNCREIGQMIPRWGNHPRRVHLDVLAHRPPQSRRYSGVRYDWDLGAALNTDLFNAELLEEFHFRWSASSDRADDDDADLPDVRITVNLTNFLLQGAQSFPVLRSIRISFFDDLEIGCPRKIPLYRLGVPMGALQHLVLERCEVDWNAPGANAVGSGQFGIRNLLTLHFIQIDPPPPTTVINAILTSSPNLASLHLDVDGSDDQEFSPPLDWSAPFLQDVDLSLPHLSCRRMMLKILSMNPSAHMHRFVGRLLYPNPEHRLADLQLIAQWINWLTLSDFSKSHQGQLHIEEVSNALAIFVEPCPTTQKDKESSLSVYGEPLALLDLDRAAPESSILKDIQLPAHIGSISLVAVDNDDDDEPILFLAEWEDFLSRHPNIHTLHISGPMTERILRFLDPGSPEGEDILPFGRLDSLDEEATSTADADTTVPLPNLRRLTLGSVYWTRHCRQPQYPAGSTFLDSKQVLARREAAGAPPLTILGREFVA